MVFLNMSELKFVSICTHIKTNIYNGIDDYNIMQKSSEI